VSDAIPVLLYHNVPRAVAATDRLAVPYELFCAHMDVVAASKRVPLTINQLADGLLGRRPLPPRPVAITFDDGYGNSLPAVEALEERDLAATIYVTTGTLSTGAMLTEDQIRRLAGRRDRVEVGAHSVNHPHLDELKPAQVELQVRLSKERLEQILGSAVDTFAYPFGSYDRRVREIVIAAGFQSAAAVKNALSHPGDDPWAIARWTADRTTSVGQVERLLGGRGARRAWSRERLRTRGYRAARRVRRQLLDAPEMTTVRRVTLRG
jgi:peptidoglycan/xylan/chitin deacetylase (PgdA/CDA1 family)